MTLEGVVKQELRNGTNRYYSRDVFLFFICFHSFHNNSSTFPILLLLVLFCFVLLASSSHEATLKILLYQLVYFFTSRKLLPRLLILPPLCLYHFYTKLNFLHFLCSNRLFDGLVAKFLVVVGSVCIVLFTFTITMFHCGSCACLEKKSCKRREKLKVDSGVIKTESNSH